MYRKGNQYWPLDAYDYWHPEWTDYKELDNVTMAWREEFGQQKAPRWRDVPDLLQTTWKLHANVSHDEGLLGALVRADRFAEACNFLHEYIASGICAIPDAEAILAGGPRAV